MKALVQLDQRAGFHDVVAAERTLLSWIRRGLDLVGVGFVAFASDCCSTTSCCAGRSADLWRWPILIAWSRVSPQALMVRLRAGRPDSSRSRPSIGGTTTHSIQQNPLVVASPLHRSGWAHNGRRRRFARSTIRIPGEINNDSRKQWNHRHAEFSPG